MGCALVLSFISLVALRVSRAADKPAPVSGDVIELAAADAQISGPEARLEGDTRKDIVWWTGGKTSIRWSARIPKPGTYQVVLNYSL